MITLTWIRGKEYMFDETRTAHYGKIDLYLFGNLKYSSIWVDMFDELDFVEVGRCKLMRILYGI